MKRGALRAYIDTNRGNLQTGHKKKDDHNQRRPSRIEERIRFRKLRFNNIQRTKSPSIKNEDDNPNSRSSSSTKTNSSENCNFIQIRDSKQRVDLLELRASNRSPVGHIISKKPEGFRPKINGDKLESLLLCRRPKTKARAKSAPCTPLFKIKYAKNNFNRNLVAADAAAGNGKNYVDYKIVEKDCIASTTDQEKLIANDETISNDEPIGNPELISVMTESLDKMMRENLNLKTRKSSGEIRNEERDFNSNSEPVSNELLGVGRIEEIERNSVPQSPEITLKASASLEASREEVEQISASLTRQEPNLEARNEAVCKTEIQKCLSCKIVENKRPKFVGTETADRCNNRCKIAARFQDSQMNKARDRRLHCGYNNICRNDFERITQVSKDCVKKSARWSNSIRDYSQPSSALQAECTIRKNRRCSTCRSNFESRSEIRGGEDRSAVLISGGRKIVQSGKKLANYTAAIGSCDCNCDRTEARICCRRYLAPRSKSSPRKVTFCLPSLIPEEEEKTLESYPRVCTKCGGTGCSGTGESAQNLGELKKPGFLNPDVQESKKSGRASRCNFHPHCGCNFHRKSRSPRVDLCREIVAKDQDVVTGDFNDVEERSRKDELQPEDSESKTSVTSAKEWADDTVAQNFNNLSFPKETRQAMNVILQSRAGNTTTEVIRGRENSHVSITGQQNRPRERLAICREDKPTKKPDLEIFDTAGHKAMNTCCSYPQQESGVSTAPPGISCKKKLRRNNILWKGNDGEIHSGYNTCCEFESHNIVERLLNLRNRARNQRLSFSRNKLETECKNRTLNVPNNQPTGLTMQTNGSDNGSSENGVDRTGWTVGLINGRFKYLTAETFGFKINANGASLKKKQLWTLEGSEHQVFLRSHLDRYLAVDQFGNVTCEAEDTADPGCAFQIQVASDGSGRWALKNIQRGYFLGSSQDELKCTAKVPGDAEYWLVHLAARPQVNLRSAGRKRFAHLSAAQDEIHVDAPVPWGEDTLFTLEFRPAAMPDNVDGNADARREVRSEAGIGGHYALHTCNNKYLARDGKLLDSCTRDCLYAAEFHAGMLALRDVSGAYLAPIGSKAVLKSRSNTVTRDELFSLEDSLPQASFVAALNQRYVSVKQGVDVTANQDEISGHETFQLEFDRATKRWYLRTMQDRYWTLEAGGGIQASDHKRSSNALFDLVWQPADGTVALRANNGKFLATKRSGHLYANADSPGDSEASKFYFYLMNRPVLVLRCEQGFVGLKSNASPKLECNKASYETIRVERCDRGIVRFKGQNGKYWHADSEGVTSDADVPSDGFYLELREPSRICIKSTDGRYLSAGKNGVFRLGDTDYESATKWEF